MRVSVQFLEPNGQSTTAVGPSIYLGRDAECEITVDPVVFPVEFASDAVFEPVPTGPTASWPQFVLNTIPDCE